MKTETLDNLPNPISLQKDDSLDSVLLARNISYFYGEGENRKQILFDIDLEISPGELVIMTGPSGSGKSTLISLIGALRTIQEGELNIMGSALHNANQNELVNYRQNLGFIFQMHNLFESLTARENVKMALQLKSYSRKEKNTLADDILTHLGLDERLNYKPDSLSGGQRQRVAIARALVNKPKLILADEPTAALDKESGQTVIKLLRTLCEENGSTVFLITHDNRILDYADRIINMVDGRIVSNVLIKEEIAVCEFLRRSETFSKLTPDALTEVARKMNKEKFSTEETIIRQGDPGEKFYLIQKGLAEVIVDDGSASKVVATLKDGDFFGEAALITEEPRNATVQVKEKTTLFSLNKQEFKDAMKACKSFEDQLLNVFFQRQ
jgi:putative ABC transport system ATP-binding protein